MDSMKLFVLFAGLSVCLADDARHHDGCPDVGDDVGICVERCTLDWQCNATQVCCFNGCGHNCMDPVKDTTDETHPCMYHNCKEHEMCDAVDMMCDQPPCRPMALCVPCSDPTRCPCYSMPCGDESQCVVGPGECTHDRCSYTFDCIVPPVQYTTTTMDYDSDTHPCMYKYCEDYEMCETMDMMCADPPCHPIATCVSCSDPTRCPCMYSPCGHSHDCVVLPEHCSHDHCSYNYDCFAHDSPMYGQASMTEVGYMVILVTTTISMLLQ